MFSLFYARETVYAVLWVVDTHLLPLSGTGHEAWNSVKRNLLTLNRTWHFQLQVKLLGVPGRSLDRVPMRWIFLMYLILPPAIWP
jgi:hypothetical protein